MKCGFHIISVTAYLENTVEIKLSHEWNGRNPRKLRSSIKQLGRISRLYIHNRLISAMAASANKLGTNVVPHYYCSPDVSFGVHCYLLSLQESNWPHVTYVASRRSVWKEPFTQKERFTFGWPSRWKGHAVLACESVYRSYYCLRLVNATVCRPLVEGIWQKCVAVKHYKAFLYGYGKFVCKFERQNIVWRWNLGFSRFWLCSLLIYIMWHCVPFGG